MVLPVPGLLSNRLIGSEGMTTSGIRPWAAEAVQNWGDGEGFAISWRMGAVKGILTAAVEIPISFSSPRRFRCKRYFLGDHGYVDVIVGHRERMIIDIDFRIHFEIARAIESYDALLKKASSCLRRHLV